jgi:hypothetical protein
VAYDNDVSFMSLRSNFLIHWTGKDIANDRRAMNDDQRRRYVDRLRATLASGLWMMTPEEKLKGKDGAWIEYRTPMTCFTEIRLSRAEEHTGRYGLLGLVVDRAFVLDRDGGPVHYVRNGPEDGIIGNAAQFVTPEADRRLSAPTDLRPARNLNFSFLKAMSSYGTDDFVFLEEHEWRIVHTFRQQENGNIRPSGTTRPQFFIHIQPHHLRLLIFPDLGTRSLAFSDPDLKAKLVCPCLTVDDCLDF